MSNWSTNYFFFGIYTLGSFFASLSFQTPGIIGLMKSFFSVLKWVPFLGDVWLIFTPVILYTNRRSSPCIQFCQDVHGSKSPHSCSTFTDVGVYRGNMVAIKRINKQTVSLNREMLKELNMVTKLSFCQPKYFLRAPVVVLIIELVPS